MGCDFAYMIPDPGRLEQHSDQVTVFCRPIRSRGKIFFLICKTQNRCVTHHLSSSVGKKGKVDPAHDAKACGGVAELCLYSFLTSGLKGEVVITLRLFYLCEELENALSRRLGALQSEYTPVFLNRRAAARYQALVSIMPSRERFSWNLSF